MPLFIIDPDSRTPFNVNANANGTDNPSSGPVCDLSKIELGPICLQLQAIRVFVLELGCAPQQVAEQTLEANLN